MSRRQRVPRLKEHRRKRNKNPKLSPFQREQQRAKLANQAPITSMKKNQRDYPISQRAVMEYLMEKQKRQEERRQRRRSTASTTTVTTEGSAAGDDEASVVALSGGGSGSSGGHIACATKKTGDNQARKHLQRAKKASAIKPVALNQQFADSLAKPIMAFRACTENGIVSSPQDTVDAIIARKKERKHRKKVEARRVRVRQQLEDVEKQLKEELVPAKGNKRRNRTNAVDAKDQAFEKKLRQMQKEKANEERQSLSKQGADASAAKIRRKRVSFSENVANVLAEDAPHNAMRYPNDKGGKKPREFYELVDVVRYGERVEAPPVFDELPRHDASITRLANRLEQSSQRPFTMKDGSSRAERLQLLSCVGGLGEKKRLERLGLSPIEGPTTDIRVAAGSVRVSQQLSKEEEMQRLRESVMNAYRRNRRGEVDSRKGVDMHHQFPLFS